MGLLIITVLDMLMLWVLDMLMLSLRYADASSPRYADASTLLDNDWDYDDDTEGGTEVEVFKDKNINLQCKAPTAGWQFNY